MRHLSLAFLTILSTAAVSDASVNVKPPFKIRWSKTIDGGFQPVSMKHGVVYFDNPSAGGAVDIKTGKSLWQWQLNDGMNFESDNEESGVGVDEGVIYSSTDQAVQAQAQRIGAVLWSIKTAARPTVYFVNGKRLYASLKPGELDAIDTSTRRSQWTTKFVDNGVTFHPDVVRSIPNDRLIVAATKPNDYGDGPHFANIYSISATNGHILWRTRLKFAYEAWCSSARLTPSAVYCTFNGLAIMAISLKDGRLLWRVNGSFHHSQIVGNLLAGVDGASVRALRLTDGKQIWSRRLSTELEPTISAPALIGNDLLFATRQGLIRIEINGRIAWTYPLADLDPIFMPIPTSDGLLLKVENQLTRYVMGTPPPLPASQAQRIDLARRLVSRMDTLNVHDRHMLISLGNTAWNPVLEEVKRRLQIYNEKEDFKYYSSYSDSIKTLLELMAPSHTQDVIDLMTLAKPVKGDDSTSTELLGLLEYKGDPKLTVPLFLDILQARKPQWDYTPSATSTALRVVSNSTDPAAVTYMRTALDNDKADAEIRHAAYINLARTDGTDGAAAVLRYRDTARTRASIDQAMQLSTVGRDPGKDQPSPGTATRLVSTHDVNGVTYGVLTSPVAGSWNDLWIVRWDGSHWTSPVFTGLSTDQNGALPSWQALLSKKGQPDSDGDGLCDLLENRLGTDPHKPDTDGDGLTDDVDANPLTGVRLPGSPLGETEAVLSATFEAVFKFYSSPSVPCVVTLPESVDAFDLYGSGGPILVYSDRKKHSIGDTWNHGTAFINFEPPMIDFDGTAYLPRDQHTVVRWNADHTRALVAVSKYYGGLNGRVIDVELARFGAKWIVVRETTRLVS